MELYLTKDGQQQGPHSLEEVNSMLETEAITGEDLCWYDGCENWIPLSSVPGFAAPNPEQHPHPAPPGRPSASADRALETAARHGEQALGSPDLIRELQKHPLGPVMVAVTTLAAILIWCTEQEIGAKIASAAIGISGILGGIEASRLGIGRGADMSPGGKRKWGPWNWGAFIGLFWVIGFPAYLYRRRLYGALNLLWPGLGVAILLIAALAVSSPALPEVDAPEVVALAQRVLQESPAIKLAGPLLGPISINDAGQVSYDPKRQKRVARAVLKSKLGSEIIYYSVEWQNREEGRIWVQIQDHE